MEENKFEFTELANNWMSLKKEIKKGKLSFDVFSDTFSKTYQLLNQKASEFSIEKNLLSIIINASLFAHAEVSENVESKFKAALVLTERMLDAVMCQSAETSKSQSTIYILELRQEIQIDFNEVDEAIDSLARYFEADFWNKISM